MTTSATGTASPVVGSETAVANITGGPFDRVAVYVEGGTGGGDGLNQYRLYALVGSVTTLIAQTQVNGSATPTLLQWSSPNTGAVQQSYVTAGGTTYSLTVQDLSTNVPFDGSVRTAVTATVAGVNVSNVAADTNASQSLDCAARSTAYTTPFSGYAQYLDLAISQNGVPAKTVISLLASNGGGSLEAVVASATLPGGGAGTFSVFRQLELPVASSYRVSIANPGNEIVIPVATASYSKTVAGSSVTLGGDVVGPGNANTVQTISGNAGVLSIASNSWVVTQGLAWTMSQTQQGNAAAPHNMVVAPQAPGGSATNATNGTPGSYVVDVAAPVNGGAEAGLLVQRAGADLGFIASPTGALGLGYGAIWLGNNAAIGEFNYVLASDGAGRSFFNGVVFLDFQVNGNTVGEVSGTQWHLELPTNLGFLTLAVSAGANALTLMQSNANVAIFTGTLAGAPTVTYDRDPTNTTLVFVRNLTNQTLTVAYSTGGTVTLATNTSALIASDGTNLHIIMVGT